MPLGLLRYWPLYVAQEQQAVRCDSQVFYDHSKGNYAVSGWVAEGMTGWHKRDPIAPNKFSPDAMAARSASVGCGATRPQSAPIGQTGRASTTP